MTRFARTYLIDKAEAENVVQDIFIYLWENRMSLEGINSIQAFLFTLVKRRCIDALRKKLVASYKGKTLDEVKNHEYQYKLYSLESFDENRLSYEDIERLLSEAINRLPEKCRRIFIECKINHKSHQKIADEMGISVQTVKNQMMIALRKLREEMKDYLPLLVFLFGLSCQP